VGNTESAIDAIAQIGSQDRTGLRTKSISDRSAGLGSIAAWRCAILRALRSISNQPARYVTATMLDQDVSEPVVHIDQPVVSTPCITAARRTEWSACRHHDRLLQTNAPRYRPIGYGEGGLFQRPPPSRSRGGARQDRPMLGATSLACLPNDFRRGVRDMALGETYRCQTLLVCGPATARPSSRCWLSVVAAYLNDLRHAKWDARAGLLICNGNMLFCDGVAELFIRENMVRLRTSTVGVTATSASATPMAAVPMVILARRRKRQRRSRG
jgi:hypothetical protein